MFFIASRWCFNQKTVSSEDKFKVVNKIKKHIVALKQEERLNAIKILKAKKEAMQKEEMKKSTSEMPSKMTDAMDKEPNEQMEMGKNQPKEGEMSKRMEEMNSKNMPSNMNQMMPKNSNMGKMENTPLMQAIRIDNQRLNEPSSANQRPSNLRPFGRRDEWRGRRR